MKLNKMTISLTQEEHQTLLEIFRQYLTSYADVEKNELRINPNEGNFAEFRFIRDYIKIIYGEFEYREFFEKCIEKRKEHIEWLFGSDSEGIPQFKLPENYDEMKELLLEYDMDWLGHRGYG